MPDKLSSLMRKLDYQFNDDDLLKLALTHRSKGAQNYERLEFLGDSLLGFVIADWLYREYPKLAEGKLSRMRSSLVRRESLAEVARGLGLSQYLLLGEGELKSGGFNRDSILSDTIESIIGAIYLDSSLIEARQFIVRNFKPLFAKLSEESTFKDAKSKLQEFMQKKGLALPKYEIIETTGQQHRQTFTVECSLVDSEDENGGKTTATAGSRRLAEQKSADMMLDLLHSDSTMLKTSKIKQANNG